MIIHSNSNANTLLIHDHHPIRDSRILAVEKLTLRDGILF